MSYVSQLFAIGAAHHRAVHTETITHYPLGNLSEGVDVQALVDFSQPLGTNEMPGDGAITADDHGDRERVTIHIEVPIALVVTVKRDLWRIDGELFTTQREEGTDTGDHANFKGYRLTGNRRLRDAVPQLRPTSIPRGGR